MYKCSDCSKIFGGPMLSLSQFSNGKSTMVCPYCLSENHKEYSPFIVSGFPGVGKTWMFNNAKLKILDSDSSKFSHLSNGDKNPSFPQNYMNNLSESMYRYDIIFVSSHDIVRQALRDKNIDYILCYPEMELKEEYISRYKKRGNTTQFLELMNNNWDTFIQSMINDPSSKRIILKSGEYLSQYLKSIGDQNKNEN